MKFGSPEYFEHLKEIQRSGPRESSNFERSSVEVFGALGLVRIQFESRLSPRLRREIIRGFFRHNKEWLRYFHSIGLTHWEQVSVDPLHAEKRGLPLFQFRNFDDPLGHLGSEIQLRRLKLGLTQAELAFKCGMDRGHLSKIERGLVDIKPSTHEKLWEATQPKGAYITYEDSLLRE